MSQYKLKVILALMFICVFKAWADIPLKEIKNEHQARLEQSLKALAEQREYLKSKILPLSEGVRQQKKEEQLWREKYRKLQGSEDSQTLSLDDLRFRRDESKKELEHLENVLVREFMVEERSSLLPFDPQSEVLRQLDLNIESGVIPETQSLTQQLSAMVTMVEELPSLFGVRMITTKAMDEKGHWHEGVVYDMGPEQFFKANASMLGGRLIDNAQDRTQFSDDQSEAILAWVKGKIEWLPLDVSGGNALKVTGIKTTWLEHIEKGGIWVYPIVGFAALAALAAIMKLLHLYTIRVSPSKVGLELARLIKDGQTDLAKAMATQQPRSCRGMWLAGLEGQGDPDLSEELMSEVLMEVQPRYERFLSFIAITAAIAPLLGLLGTVTGIIKTFQMMEIFGAGDPKPLIGGISEALITTELGLILAIPALLLHALLSRRAQSVLAKMERSSLAMVHGLMRTKAGVSHGT